MISIVVIFRKFSVSNSENPRDCVTNTSPRHDSKLEVSNQTNKQYLLECSSAVSRFCEVAFTIFSLILFLIWLGLIGDNSCLSQISIALSNCGKVDFSLDVIAFCWLGRKEKSSSLLFALSLGLNRYILPYEGKRWYSECSL